MWSLYIPNGRTLEDPHYTYKLDWLAALRDTAAGWLKDDPGAPIALVGDWNIAPADEDVWDMTAFEGRTHVSGPERAAFNAIVDAQFTDVVRPFTPGPGIYTYWDYTQLRVPEAPRHAHRLHPRLTGPGRGACTHAEIVKDERRPGKKGTIAPSDHAPVMVELTG